MDHSYHWKVVGSAYDTFAESEEARLKNDSNPLEFILAKHLIEKYLEGRDRILDIGSGPGVYSIWLALMGKQVKLIDVSARCLMLAEYRATKAAVKELISTSVGDCGNLHKEGDNTYDMALALGPIYHAPDEEYVLSSIRELKRVLKPNGIVVLNIVHPFHTLKKLYPRESIADVNALLSDVLDQGFCYYKGEGDDIGTWMCTGEYIKQVLNDSGFTIKEYAGSKAIFQGADRSIVKNIKEDATELPMLIIRTSTIPEYISQSEYGFLVAENAA